MALVILADAYLGHGDEARVTTALEEALALYRWVESDDGATDALLGLATVALNRGEVERARPLLGAGLRFLRTLGAERATADALLKSARVAAALGEPERAVQLLGSVVDRAAARRLMSPAERDGLDRDLAAWRALLGAAAFEVAAAAGRRLTSAEAPAEALAIVQPSPVPLPDATGRRPLPRRAGVGGAG